MKSLLIQLLVAYVAVHATPEIRPIREIVDLVIEISGNGIPVTNDLHCNQYLKDYFGLVFGYSTRTKDIIKRMGHDYERWADHLKSDTKGLELLKSAYTNATGELIAYQNVVENNYQEGAQKGIEDWVKAINYMRHAGKSFYSKFKLHSQKCHDFLQRNLYHKWEKTVLDCSSKSIPDILILQLRFTYDLNVYYAQWSDCFGKFATILGGERDDYLAATIKLVNVELWQNRAIQIASIRKLLNDAEACVVASYDVFAGWQKSFQVKAADCF